jgi:hypothetical protein
MKLRIAFCATLVIAAAAAFGAGSPAAAQPPGGPSAAPQGGNADAAQSQSRGRSCFWIRNVRGFRSVDNRTVYVRAGNDIFALELFAPCPGVDWAHNASLRSRAGNSICEGRGNALNIYVRQTGGRRPQRCAVTNVRRLTPPDIAGLPRGARP